MRKEKYYLGLDTSAYTSSIAIINDQNDILYNEKMILKVKDGSIGLRQQDALFQHLNNTSKLINTIKHSDFEKINKIGVSTRPRNLENSYMPVFLQGEQTANMIGHILDLPVNNFSHQEGHIAAGLIDNDNLLSKKFVAIHLSGGTTELIYVKDFYKLDYELIGESLDISFGQLIDRIGVYLGYKFPSGKIVDNKSLEGKIIDKVFVPIKLNENLTINLSGYENFFKKLIDSGKYKEEDILATLMNTIKKIIKMMIIQAKNICSVSDILLIGGVSESSYLRSGFSKDCDIYFAREGLSSDNAVGVAYLSKLIEDRRT